MTIDELKKGQTFWVNGIGPFVITDKAGTNYRRIALDAQGDTWAFERGMEVQMEGPEK